MKKTIIIFIVLLSSCSSRYYDIDYKGEKNYKSFYIVDTITISNPIKVFSKKYGGPFVFSKNKLKDYNQKWSFFMEPDVFICGFDLYYVLDYQSFKKYKYPDYGGCDEKESDIKVRDLEIYEYPKNTKFILGLINGNYYHIKHRSERYFRIPIKNLKSIYIKIVYPLCE
ncbi:hypothetical protein TRIP_D310003 [uncultured Paludibacter sp.]|uniref:Lipoprotein n=1 Tax=uncultured Paludibacter sp. TaxID=497635 RepID=A0A653AC20_9BACT|nr:hypothetical protein TRIP_D310003 [uncultured Paludibacter sp.]